MLLLRLRRLLLAGGAFALCVGFLFGQTGTMPTNGGPANSSSTNNGSANGSSGTTPVRKDGYPDYEPSVLEDGGISIEPIYWLNRTQPLVQGGAQATEYGTLGYPGNARPSFGGEVSIPAGHSDSLRLSYFRSQGSGNSTFAQGATIFSEGYSTGDSVVANYLIQDWKLSWDYLTYSWAKAKGGPIRFKTLWEVQLVNAGMNAVAPYKAVTTDSNGNTDYNAANGTKTLVWPTFGVEFEQRLWRNLRWEAKGSGFGILHRGNIWDVEGSLAYRVRDFELIAGEKAFHFKTSSEGSEFFVDTLSGAYVGVRYYWGGIELSR